jgi:hypothetical protein
MNQYACSMSSRYRLYSWEKDNYVFKSKFTESYFPYIYIYIYIYIYVCVCVCVCVNCKSRIPRNVVLFTRHSKPGNCFLQRQWNKWDLWSQNKLFCVICQTFSTLNKLIWHRYLSFYLNWRYRWCAMDEPWLNFFFLFNGTSQCTVGVVVGKRF